MEQQRYMLNDNIAGSSSGRMALEVPDNLHMMEEAEGAQDPFFGLMESYQLPSPYKIHPVYLIHASAQ